MVGVHSNDMESSETRSSSGTSSPDNDLNLESSRLLSGSYTILNGEIRLSKLEPGSQGDGTELNGVKRAPPPVPPKPTKPQSVG